MTLYATDDTSFFIENEDDDTLSFYVTIDDMGMSVQLSREEVEAVVAVLAEWSGFPLFYGGADE
jgi:hypothetical protein|tara:strand:- start:11160 stop:11351 length:192 start_codon:yes stop_codon:yes gene_type:complete